MYVDELMIQIKAMDKIFCDIVNRYQYGNDGYRIEQHMEHEAAGICGLRSLREEKPDPEEDMCMLFFLVHEKKCMMEAVSKYQKENNMILFRSWPDRDNETMKNEELERVTDEIAILYQKRSTQKRIQKADGGYDMIVTKTSKIDKALLDELHHKFNRDYDTFQKNKEQCKQVEIDYEPTIDFTQYDKLGFKEYVRKLKEKGGSAEWKLQ